MNALAYQYEASEPHDADSDAGPGAEPARPLALEVEGLVKRYDGRAVVDGVSLRVREGEILGFLGPNGAGKTTTLEMIEGLREPDEGSIRVLGLDRFKDLRKIRERLGVSLQKTRYWGLLSVRETIKLFQSFYPKRLPLDQLVEAFDLGEFLDKKMQHLSGGQYQRVVIALALANDPDLVLLDEPTIGLDPFARRQLWKAIRELKARGKTVILTTHYMDEAEALSDRVAIIHQGRIVDCGPPEELIRALHADIAVHFSSAAPIASEHLEALVGLSWCREAKTVKPGRYVALTTNLKEGLAGLLEWASARRIAVDNVETRTATLDDVFLNYAKNVEGADPCAR